MFECVNTYTRKTTQHKTHALARSRANRLNRDYGAHIAFARPLVSGIIRW